MIHIYYVYQMIYERNYLSILIEIQKYMLSKVDCGP